MKRMSLLILSAVAALAVQAAITVTPESPYSESFEGGFAGWTQEYVVGEVDWTRDAGSPAQGKYGGAYDGSQNLLFYFEDYGRTTRLISPEFDLSGLAHPLLSFYLANEPWSADQDILVVLFRASASDPWTEVATIGKMSDWTLQNYSLPSASATAQIAFEAQGNYGYGIAIDLVTVGEETTPAAPVIQSAESTYSTISYSWTVSATAEHSQYVFSFQGGLDDAQLESMATDLPSGQTTYVASGLPANNSYWFYVRAVNGSDVSDWTKIYAYTMYRGTGLTCTSKSDYTRIFWNQQLYTDLFQLVISAEALSEEDLAALPAAQIMQYLPSDPREYEHYGNFGKTYHAYGRYLYQDIGFGEWDELEYTQQTLLVNRISVADLSPYDATLKWYSPTNADGVIVSDNPDLTDDELNMLTYEARGDQTYYLYGLMPGQTVTVYISATVNDDKGRPNVWTPVTIKTLPEPDNPVMVTNSQAFVEDFETATPRWTYERHQPGCDWFVGNGLHVDVDYFEHEAFQGRQNVCFGAQENVGVTAELISPVLDITAVAEPKLSFYYINPKWSEDYNSLEVFYRLSPSSEWVSIQTFPDPVESWTLFETALPVKSNQLQIILRGTNGYGYGFGIDSLRVGNVIDLDPSDCSVPVTVTPGVPFHEGFEGDDLGCWTQEYLLGSESWHLDAGGEFDGNVCYDSQAYAGDKNVFLGNPNTNETRLISPVFDLTQVPVAYLSFYLRKQAWGSDLDELFVEYRSSSSDEWHLLADFTGNVAQWIQLSYALPNPSNTYQIAFRGITHYGYGIAIDELEVTATASVHAPAIIDLKPMRWQTSLMWDDQAAAESYQVGIAPSDVLLDVSQMDAAPVVSITQTNWLFEDLEPGTPYSIFVRAFDGSDYTEWTQVLFNTDIDYTNMNVTPFGGGLSVDLSNSGQDYDQVYFSETLLSDSELDMLPVVDVTLGNVYEEYGLQAETPYYVYYRSVWPDGVGQWRETDVTTLPLRVNLYWTDLTSSSLAAAWDDASIESSWWYLLSTNPALSDAELESQALFTSERYMGEGLLEPGTNYTLYVRADLSNAQWTSITGRTYNVDPIVVTDAAPYLNDFETEVDWNSVGQVHWQAGTGCPWDDNTDRYAVQTANSGMVNLYAGSRDMGTMIELVGPWFDMSQVTQPCLRFFYRNGKWGSDQDVLRVYYRATEYDAWQLLATYDSDVQDWTQQEILLPEPLSVCQFLFESEANYGYGVGLDDIYIGSKTAVQVDEAAASANGVTLFASAGCIHVLGAPSAAVVTTLVGQTVAVLAGEGELTAQVPSGIYLVRVADRTYKLLVP